MLFINANFDSSLRNHFKLMRSLGFKLCLDLFLHRLFFISNFYVLKRNLKSLQFEKTIRFQYHLDKITIDDWYVIAENIKSADQDTRREFYSRLLFYKAGLKNCYVLKNKNDEIACMLWIIYPSENEIIKKHFNKKFNLLKENQVMLENVFTLPKFRGFGFSPTLTIEMLHLAKSQGYKNAIIYCKKDRIDSLNDIIRLGFKIHKLIKEYRVFGFVWRTL